MPLRYTRGGRFLLTPTRWFHIHIDNPQIQNCCRHCIQVLVPPGWPLRTPKGDCHRQRQGIPNNNKPPIISRRIFTAYARHAHARGGSPDIFTHIENKKGCLLLADLRTHTHTTHPHIIPQYQTARVYSTSQAKKNPAGLAKRGQVGGIKLVSVV